MDKYEYQGKLEKAYDDGFKTGYMQAKFDYEPHWIPVTENMPDEYKAVICRDKHGRMMVGKLTRWGWIFPCYFDDPVAWMPIPEWKGEG